MTQLPPKSLVVFAPSYAIACDCLRVDYGIDPRHPALDFIRRPYELHWRSGRTLAVMIVDPLDRRNRDDDFELAALRGSRRIRDWTADEIAAVSLPGWRPR